VITPNNRNDDGDPEILGKISGHKDGGSLAYGSSCYSTCSCLISQRSKEGGRKSDIQRLWVQIPTRALFLNIYIYIVLNCEI
jgi:hypothetical protein